MDDRKKTRGDQRRPTLRSTRESAKRGAGRPISPLVGEMSTKPTEGGVVPSNSPRPDTVAKRKGKRPSLPLSALPGISPTRGEIGQGSERIAKRLARAGISSRREAEALIAAGRVRVNGAVLASPAFNVGPQDRIEVDGTPIPAIERTRLFLFHKPAGVVTTNRDPEGRRTVFDCLPE